jgi:YVTN family beta-propeller protein
MTEHPFLIRIEILPALEITQEYYMRLPFPHIILFALLISSCKKDVGYVNYGNYPAEIGKIISQNCSVSGCHNEKSYPASANYNLTSWKSMFAGSSNGSPVIPYSSRFSSLCSFINTYSDLGLQNVPVMPLNKNPLSHDLVKQIKDWIDAGAPDVNGNIMWGDNPLRKKLYAVNQGCNVVTVFDSETQLPIRFIDVGRPRIPDSPHQVRVSPDGKYWYVVFVNNNVIEKHRCSDDAFVANIPLTPYAAGTSTDNINDNALYWNTFIISSDSKRAYCVSFQPSGKISAVDLENEKLLYFTGGPSSPHASALNRDNSSLYIGAQSGNYITEWATDFSSYTNISLDGNPVSSASSLDIHDMHLDSAENNLWITCQKSNEVRVFNITTNSVTAIIPVGFYPQEIVYSKSTQQYFVSCPEDVSIPGTHGAVTRINANNYSDVKTIPCGYQPHGICVDENKKLLYVLSRNVLSTGPAPHHTSSCTGRNGFVNFINLNTFTILGNKYEMASDPYFIFARP